MQIRFILFTWLISFTQPSLTGIIQYHPLGFTTLSPNLRVSFLISISLARKNIPHRNESLISGQWLFLVPLKGGRWYIIPQLAGKIPLYIPLIVLAEPGGLYNPYHLLPEPEKSIDQVLPLLMKEVLALNDWSNWGDARRMFLTTVTCTLRNTGWDRWLTKCSHVFAEVGDG